MELFLDMAYKSLFKSGEELCGDKVEIVKNHNSKIMILTDGMGSGVRANILATMTSKILGTLFIKELAIDEAVDTIAKTLPISSVNQVAYSTFSILQIFQDGRAYLVEYDNPACICIRNHQRYELPFTEREVYGKKIRECRFRVAIDDAYILMSDGALYCGGDQIINYAWDRTAIANYAQKCESKCKSASRLACMLDDACKDLYLDIPTDDTTIAVARVKEEQLVSILTGPPKNKEDDAKIVADFMKGNGKKVVCGGTTSEILARTLHREITTDMSTMDPDIPPMSIIHDIDLVTEGIVTLHQVIKLLEEYNKDDVDPDIFLELDKNNGASKMASLIIDNCTKVVFYVGTATNEAKSEKSLSFDVTTRNTIVNKFQEQLLAMGKDVEINYY